MEGITMSTATRIVPATVTGPLFGPADAMGPSTDPTTSNFPNSEPDAVAGSLIGTVDAVGSVERSSSFIFVASMTKLQPSVLYYSTVF
jgi:hypothetical protein